jgi:tRNA pseudouridine55 synthase
MTYSGALLINKHEGVSSFGVIELLQNRLMEETGLKRRDLPKLGHGGTLDPFATGLLIVLVGRGVKLARYFLGSSKGYSGQIRFGETTVPGDPTSPVSETSPHVPNSLEAIRDQARRLTLQPYLQIPPMHSAKKKNGKPLYELARAGIEIERAPKACQLYEFDILDYTPPRARFALKCSSGTYVRTLAQDLGRWMNSVALLDSLHRTSSGIFSIGNACTTDEVAQAMQSGKKWNQLPCWIPFDRLLDGYARAEATPEEQNALCQGKQNVLINIIKRMNAPTPDSPDKEGYVAIYSKDVLIAVARLENEQWGIERVFT